MNDDRFKDRPKPPEKDRFATLKAWVFWASKNPLSEDQELMAKDVNDLFALLGTREARIEMLNRENERLASAAHRSMDRCEELREALEGLKRGDDCFCEMAIGNPMMRDHSQGCKAAHAALEVP